MFGTTTKQNRKGEITFPSLRPFKDDIESNIRVLELPINVRSDEDTPTMEIQEIIFGYNYDEDQFHTKAIEICNRFEQAFNYKPRVSQTSLTMEYRDIPKRLKN